MPRFPARNLPPPPHSLWIHKQQHERWLRSEQHKLKLRRRLRHKRKDSPRLLGQVLFCNVSNSSSSSNSPPLAHRSRSRGMATTRVLLPPLPLPDHSPLRKLRSCRVTLLSSRPARARVLRDPRQEKTTRRTNERDLAEEQVTVRQLPPPTLRRATKRHPTRKRTRRRGRRSRWWAALHRRFHKTTSRCGNALRCRRVTMYVITGNVEPSMHDLLGLKRRASSRREIA